MFKYFRLNQFTIILLIIAILLGIMWVGNYLENRAVADAFPNNAINDKSKTQYEIYKLTAEIRQIRSDTAGRLFWLKLVALFVTVGGAVGGYLIGQSKASRDRLRSEDKRNEDQLNFEHRKDVDATYQQIVQELSAGEAVLRAAAAVKLGAILRDIPAEWNISDERKQQLVKLTKQVLAAALAIEKESKVLKTITIALVLHRPQTDPPKEEKDRFSQVSGLDLSYANASDAYWAKADFAMADFYKATLRQVSFRNSILFRAQFREADLRNAVFINASCKEANFKLANLRNADFSKADLLDANFENAKVHGLILKETKMPHQPDVMVDISPDNNTPEMIPFDQWIARQTF